MVANAATASSDEKTPLIVHNRMSKQSKRYDRTVLQMGKNSFRAKEAKQQQLKEKKNRNYAWWQWLMLGGFALFFGLANGANNAASTIRALPAMISMSSGWLQFAMSTLSVFGAVMNVMVIMMAFPTVIKFFKEKFYRGKDGKHGDVHHLSKKKKIMIGVAALFTLATCVGVGFFTFESVPTVIVGIGAVFGLTIGTGGFGIIAAAIILTAVQVISMFLLLFKDSVNLICNASIENLKKFFMVGNHKPKNVQEHFMRVGRLLMNLVGVGILLLAGAFMIFGQASAAFATLRKWELSTVAANLITGVFIYGIASLSHFAIRVCSANGVFGQFGNWLGKKMGYVFLSPENKKIVDSEAAKEKAQAKAAKLRPWSEKSVPEKVQTVLKIIWPITFIALIANTIGEAFNGMRGDHLLHEGGNTEGSDFHHEADKIAENPGEVYNAKAVGATAPEYISGAVNGAASATLVTYFVFACDLNEKPNGNANARNRFGRQHYNLLNGRGRDTIAHRQQQALLMHRYDAAGDSNLGTARAM